MMDHFSAAPELEGIRKGKVLQNTTENGDEEPENVPKKEGVLAEKEGKHYFRLHLNDT
jgi:hypothetical protein